MVDQVGSYQLVEYVIVSGADRGDDRLVGLPKISRAHHFIVLRLFVSDQSEPAV
jgi:hypothetical protein